MSQTSPVLSLPYIQPSQAQKHVTHNDALRVLDAIVQLAVLDWELATPPAVPDVGVRYIVGAAGQGDWTGHDAEVAVFVEGGWLFVVPQDGWTAQVAGSADALVFDGTAWQMKGFDDLPGLGVNAQSDAVNRLSVSAEATLLNHDGAGHQLKLNKALDTETTSVLFQTGFSGRAEMGTAGTDDFAIKVSPDGNTWFDALVVDGLTGFVALPQTPSRRVLGAPTTVYVDPVLGSDLGAGDGAGASAFATLARAVSEVWTFDANGQSITIQLADGTHNMATPLLFDRSVPGASGIKLRGNPVSPAQVIITSPVEVIEVAAGRVSLEGVLLENTSPSAAALLVQEQGHATIANIDFGAAGVHMYISKGTLIVDGGYTISGGAMHHIRVEHGGFMRNIGHTANLTAVFDFSSGFVRCLRQSVIKMSGAGFTGAATGLRHLAAFNSVLDTSNGGANFFPGDVAGITSDGGIYR